MNIVNSLLKVVLAIFLGFLGGGMLGWSISYLFYELIATIFSLDFDYRTGNLIIRIGTSVGAIIGIIVGIYSLSFW